MVGLGARLLEQFVQAAAGPEPVLEAVGGTVDAPQAGDLLEHDGPDPHAGQHQHQHHQLDDDIGL